MTVTSLKDVGLRAGVSLQTLSKVFNGKGTVSPATRQRILDAADALGYVPNLLARDLQGKSTRTIGVIAADFSYTAAARVVVGIEREARRQGLGVLITSADEAGGDLERCVRPLIGRRVDGIVLSAWVAECDDRIQAMLGDRVPVVSTQHTAFARASCVVADEADTAVLPVRHLLALGHTRIGMVAGSADRWAAQVRTGGYRHALGEAGIAFDPRIVEEADWGIEGGYQATHRLLGRAPDVTAIYAQNDTMAFGVLSALHDRGRRVPEDCAVIGCDDLPLAIRTIPPLSTVHIPFYEIGESAVRLLIDHIEEREAAPLARTLPVHLVHRASSGVEPSPFRTQPDDPERQAAHPRTNEAVETHG